MAGPRRILGAAEFAARFADSPLGGFSAHKLFFTAVAGSGASQCVVILPVSLVCDSWSFMAIAHVVPGLRPAQVNWCCSPKKDTNPVADCFVVGEYLEKATSQESLCTPLGGLCSKHHSWSPARPNRTSRDTEDEVWDHMLAPIQEL